MKLFKKYNLVVAAVITLSLSACQKNKLSPVSTASLSDASVFETPDRIANLVNGLYGAIKSGNLLGGRYFIYNDIRGENFINEKSNGVTGLLVWNFTVTGGDTYVNSTWNDAYAAINKVNVFLDGMAAKGNDVVSPELASQYAAEAKFVRALAYYCLMQLYAPPFTGANASAPALPLRLTGITSSGFNDQARSTVQEVYAQIISDLNAAEADLPSDYGDDVLNTTHAHKNTAIALKTRVYLSMNDYADVITEGNKIVPAAAPFVAPTGVANQLESSIASVFSSYTTKESIFSMPFSGVSEAPGTQNQLGYYYLSEDDGGNLEYSLNPSGIIADAGWKSTDSRRGFISDAGGKLSLTKFPTGSPFTDWAPVMRYAEVLLNLAEARVRSTNTVDAQAIALLNAVRGRSDATTVFASGDFATSTDLANAIVHEREIEFLGEGLRSPDIMRLGLTFPAKGSVGAVTPTDEGYVWPAPVSETQYNTAW